MAVGRDDFVIAFRSAFLNKKGKQKFSLLSLILLSIIIIILSNINFKPISFLRVGINEIVYSVSYLISIPEKKIQKFNIQLSKHLNLFEIYQNTKIELENIRQKELTNNFLQLENQKLRKLIDENISSEEILAKVLIDKDSPFLKSIILNKGSKDSVKAGMGVIDLLFTKFSLQKFSKLVLSNFSAFNSFMFYYLKKSTRCNTRYFSCIM